MNFRDWCFMWAGVLVAALAVVAIGKFNNAVSADWAVATIGSQHLGGGDFCESNPGLGFESGDREVRSLVGVYRNSLCERWSFYVGRSWLPFYLQSSNLRLGGAAMVITGYESAITLGAALVIAYEREKHGVNLVIFPDRKGNLAQGVIGLQYKRRF